MVRSTSDQLRLRIDDADAPRVRTEYLKDIYWALDWLGISIDAGPRDVEDLNNRFSQVDKTEYYRAELATLVEAIPTYSCSCSRRELAQLQSGASHPCREVSQAHLPGVSAVRVRLSGDQLVRVADTYVNLTDTMGDFVLWRKDDRPAYQLISVIEDRDQGVNLLVRGADLLPSSAAQLFLAPALSADSFQSATFWHHALLTDQSGDKLSKSTGASSLESLAAKPDGRSWLMKQVEAVKASTPPPPLAD